MTTNHIDKLDPSIYRHGRVTRQIEFYNTLSTSEARQMIHNHFPGKQKQIQKIDLSKLDKITPAQLDGYCKMASAVNDVQKFINEAMK